MCVKMFEKGQNPCEVMCVCVLTCQLHCSRQMLPEQFMTLVGRGIGEGRDGWEKAKKREEEGGGVNPAIVDTFPRPAIREAEL